MDLFGGGVGESINYDSEIRSKMIAHSRGLACMRLLHYPFPTNFAFESILIDVLVVEMFLIIIFV